MTRRTLYVQLIIAFMCVAMVAYLVMLGRVAVAMIGSGRRRMPDLRGALLLAVTLGLVTLGLVKGPDWGWLSVATVGSFLASVLFGGQHTQVDAFGDNAVLDVVNRVGDVVGPVHHLRFQARPLRGRALPNPYRRFAVVVVEAELPPLAAKPVTTHPRILGDRVQGRAS